MEFGIAIVKGAQAIIKIDSSMEIEYRIHDCLDGGATQILRADEVLRKNDSNDEQMTTPLMQTLYMDADNSDELSRWLIVNSLIKTDTHHKSLSEETKHVANQQDQQNRAEAYACATTSTPPPVAVVCSTTA